MKWGYRRPVLAAAALAILFAGVGCGPSVSIAAQRSAALKAPLEPVVFVIHEGNTGPDYTHPLGRYLERELKKHKIQGAVRILTGVEINEQQLFEEWFARSKAVIVIAPAGGTSYYGSLTQLLYEIQVLESVGEDQVRVVWKGRVDTSSGAYEFQIDDRLELLAEDLVQRLISDQVLPRR